MPKLGNVTTTRIDLPSSTPDDPAWVEIKNELLVEDMAAITGIDNQAEGTINLLCQLIVSWNFTDDDGNAVLPTLEWVAKLRPVDFLFISEWADSHLKESLQGLDNTEKKTLSSPSIAATETPLPDYLIYQYQKLMHISYEAAMTTPLKTVMRQLEYKSLENQVKEMKQNSNAQP